MFKSQNGGFYFGDMQPGDREATLEEIAAHAIPTKAQAVAAVLAALPKPMTREQVQTTIIACEAYAKANNMTLAFIYEKTKIYKLCKDAESACQVIEAAP